MCHTISAKKIITTITKSHNILLKQMSKIARNGILRFDKLHCIMIVLGLL